MHACKHGQHHTGRWRASARTRVEVAHHDERPALGQLAGLADDQLGRLGARLLSCGGGLAVAQQMMRRLVVSGAPGWTHAAHMIKATTRSRTLVIKVGAHKGEGAAAVGKRKLGPRGDARKRAARKLVGHRQCRAAVRASSGVGSQRPLRQPRARLLTLVYGTWGTSLSQNVPDDCSCSRVVS